MSYYVLQLGLWHFIGKIYKGEQMDFKSSHYTHVTSASPHLHIRELQFFFTSRRVSAFFIRWHKHLMFLY